MLRVRGVVPRDGFTVELELTDATYVRVDLTPLLSGPIFEAVRRDRRMFAAVRVDQTLGTLAWPNGADLCPDVLLMHAVRLESHERPMRAIETDRQEEILRRLRAQRPALRRLGVRRLALFGSHLRGNARPDSDVDLLVRFDRPTFDAYMDTKFLLEEALGRRVDLVTESTLKPALRHVRDEALDVGPF
jgi:hypothetical protein